MAFILRVAWRSGQSRQPGQRHVRQGFAQPHDALNRATLITFHDGSKQAYAYDQGANALGRLSSITETDPANQQTNLIQYVYDQHGRVTSETRTVNGLAYAMGYSYDASGRLSGLTYQRAA